MAEAKRNVRKTKPTQNKSGASRGYVSWVEADPENDEEISSDEAYARVGKIVGMLADLRLMTTCAVGDRSFDLSLLATSEPDIIESADGTRTTSHGVDLFVPALRDLKSYLVHNGNPLRRAHQQIVGRIPPSEMRSLCQAATAPTWMGAVVRFGFMLTTHLLTHVVEPILADAKSADSENLRKYWETGIQLLHDVDWYKVEADLDLEWARLGRREPRRRRPAGMKADEIVAQDVHDVYPSIDRRMCQRWQESGRLPWRKIANVTLYKRADIEELGRQDGLM